MTGRLREVGYPFSCFFVKKIQTIDVILWLKQKVLQYYHYF